jgi:hypothetical protein
MVYIVRSRVVGSSLNGVPADIEKKPNQRTMLKRENAAGPSFQSPHSGVASPLDFCHFGRLNIDFERTAWPWKPMLRQRDDIVTGL